MTWFFVRSRSYAQSKSKHFSNAGFRALSALMKIYFGIQIIYITFALNKQIKSNQVMAKYKVTMTEVSKYGMRKLEQIAVCDSERDVIKFYGLHEPDILNYKIEKLED